MASELDSWLLPSANGEVPEAQECPAYASNTRRSGNAPLLALDPMSAASRFITGANFLASSGSFWVKIPAA